MTDIVEFLIAQLNVDEATALAASFNKPERQHWMHKWSANREDYSFWSIHTEPGPPHVEVAGAGLDGSGGIHDEAVAAHIARHDPARVLREIAAKRALIAYAAPPRKPETDEQLHARFAHPDYEYETTEGQRKAWARADEPPEGDGWERNIDAGRDGWDRLDYTEESYWRRLLPDGPGPTYVPTILRHLAAVYADHPDYDESWRP